MSEVQAIRFNESGQAYCPACGRYLGFLTECNNRTMLFTGTVYIDWGPRLWCYCGVMLAYRAAEMPMIDLLAKIERRINGRTDSTDN